MPAKKKSSRPRAAKTARPKARPASKKTAPKRAKAPAKAMPRRKPAVARPAAAKTSGAARSAGKLAAGAKAPDFTLTDQHGRRVRLADFRGRKVLLYFYPKADTPGCTVQSCAVRDARHGFAAEGVAVLGISPDAAGALARFDGKYELGFPLLSDADHAVAAKWGAWGPKTRYGRTYDGIIRSSFLVDEDGRIAGAWYGVKPEDTVPKAEAALAAR